MKIMLSAGEVSGDLHGASLARAILTQEPATELVGFGGQNMAAAGVRLAADMASYNVMGISEVLKNLRRLARLLDQLTEFMRQERPDLLVLIDYPDFNWRLAKRRSACRYSPTYRPQPGPGARAGRANARALPMSSWRYSRMSCRFMRQRGRIYRS